jgi:AbrB family looped-hinge helix DNA binding protein
LLICQNAYLRTPFGRPVFGWRQNRDGPAPIDPRLIDQHSRVVLPQEVKDALNAGPGDRVHFLVLPGGKVEVRKVRLSLE